MPSWPIHLAIAKKLNQKLKIDKDLFYYGNILPDVNKRYNLNRDEAHYYGIPFSFCPKEEQIDINKFLNDYHNNLNNPLVLGYYCHLMTDNYFNEYIYKKCWVLDKDNNIIGIRLKNGKIHHITKEDPKNEKRKYKHHDFELYGRNICDIDAVPKDKEKIYNNIKFIKHGFLTKEIVDDRFNYFHDKYLKDVKLSLSERIFKDKYYLFSREELDKVFNDCYKYILNELDKINKHF